MADLIFGGTRVLVCEPDGEKLYSDRDVVSVFGDAIWSQSVELVAVPVERFGEGFFTLSTRMAGEIIQKFVTYRLRLAIVGDISAHLAASSALRAFVYESNRGRDVWFVADLDELRSRLESVHAG
ncbi:MAG: alpha/beta hydrolase [Amycolatopsis sp.]|uniref:DUF4180 domain-containing protein n=1 Tax=Amycolatopsis sp. TaxID=37632 RepID=UPI002626434F|nr:DUF4180 domain-containing protein [Amycolatopsis sp.]MCU1683518.1 alpha/beta hydrolase [Amycolatopsis sp.]